MPESADLHVLSGGLSEFLQASTTRLGSSGVLTGSDCAGFTRDWTGRFAGAPAAVVRPRNVDDVAFLLRQASACQARLVVHGGGTSLVGGSTPDDTGREVVLSTALLQTLEVFPDTMLARVGAGVTLSALNEAAFSHGLRFAVDIGSRGSATLGGMVSTNAGGLRMLRFGDTAAQLVGVVAVTGSGEVLSHMRGLTKDNVGVRWPQLLSGAEGCLGVVCELLVKLVPVPQAVAYAWFPVDNPFQALDVASCARRFSEVSAVEYVEQTGLSLVSKMVGRTPPSPASAVIVEAQGDSPADVLLALADRLKAFDALVADGPAGLRLWEWRDRHTEAIALAGVPAKCDVAVPLASWALFREALDPLLSGFSNQLFPVCFGHVADGNLHVNVLSVDASAPPFEVDRAVFELAVSFGGTVSAEHGIGVAKAPMLPLVRSSAELALVEAMRHAWDPSGVLNQRVARPPVPHV